MEDLTEILFGLREGEEVVKIGSFHLKSVSMSGQIGRKSNDERSRGQCFEVPVCCSYRYGIMAVFGVFSLGQLPIDAVPDITPNQVLVLTKAPSLSPIEIEQYLRFRLNR